MKRPNFAKSGFLKELAEATIDNQKSRLLDNVSFNFQYFDDSQTAGQTFSDWAKSGILLKLLDKIREYSKETISHWAHLPIGSHGHVLEVYDEFPDNSEFRHPSYIPHDISWARFRLESGVRLIGFVLPKRKCNDFNICQNVFYVVFLDMNHRFYITETK